MIFLYIVWCRWICPAKLVFDVSVVENGATQRVASVEVFKE